MKKTPYMRVPLAQIKPDASKILCFDVETDGFYGAVQLAQFYQEGDHSVLMVATPDPYQLAGVLATFIEDGGSIACHNASYEISTIQRQTGVTLDVTGFVDTFYLARQSLPRLGSFSLDKVMTHVLGTDPYEAQGLDKKTLQKSRWTGELSADQLTYAATDVYYMPEVLAAVSDVKDSLTYKLDMLSVAAALPMQQCGMPFLAGEARAFIAEAEGNLAPLVSYLPEGLNVNSYKQVRALLGTDQSDGLFLASLAAAGDTTVQAIIEVKKLKKQISTTKKYLKASVGGRIYGVFSPSTRSGRFSCKEDNLQQIPRALKKLFGVTPDSGMVLVYSDYSQLELRIVAAITGDSAMVEAYRNNEDLHTLTDAMVVSRGGERTGRSRTIAKGCNFNLLYGGGAGMLGSILLKQAGLVIPEQELRNNKRKWHNLYRGVTRWQQKGIKDHEQGLLGSTLLGRLYKGDRMTDQLNIENQGSGAEVAKLALHYMHKAGITHSLGDFIHDSYIAIVPKGEAEATATIMGECMQKAWFQVIANAKVTDLPMPVDVFIGTNWGAIEAGQFDKQISFA